MMSSVNRLEPSILMARVGMSLSEGVSASSVETKSRDNTKIIIRKRGGGDHNIVLSSEIRSAEEFIQFARLLTV